VEEKLGRIIFSVEIDSPQIGGQQGLPRLHAS
jgi:hypothetical protein